MNYLEKILDKMPYFMLGLMEVASIIIMIYGIYRCRKKNDKEGLLMAFKASWQTFFVDLGFLAMVIGSNTNLALMALYMLSMNVIIIFTVLLFIMTF